MHNKLFSQNEWWCFPSASLPGPEADPNARGCFPATPPRSPVADPAGRGCFPEAASADSAGSVAPHPRLSGAVGHPRR